MLLRVRKSPNLLNFLPFKEFIMKISNVTLKSFILSKTNSMEALNDSSKLVFLGNDNQEYILLDDKMKLPNGDLLFKRSDNKATITIDTNCRDNKGDFIIETRGNQEHVIHVFRLTVSIRK